MGYELTDERIAELAEQEIKNHVYRVMQGLGRDNVCSSAGYDSRFEKVVKEVFIMYFNQYYKLEIKPMIDKIVREVVYEQLPKLITEKLQEEIGYNET